MKIYLDEWTFNTIYNVDWDCLYQGYNSRGDNRMWSNLFSLTMKYLQDSDMDYNQVSDVCNNINYSLFFLPFHIENVILIDENTICNFSQTVFYLRDSINYGFELLICHCMLIIS